MPEAADGHDERENGMNGDDRKGMSWSRSIETLAHSDTATETPPPAHDELDTAE